jgi:hypothetical protein
MYEKKATNWIAVDVVRQHVEAAARQVGRYHECSFLEFIESQLDADDTTDPQWRLGMESPLEAIFYVWWKAMVGEGWARKFWLDPQQWIRLPCGTRYRLDFRVNLDVEDLQRFEVAGVEWPVIAVEVDGHGFHEKTPDQVANRNERDRLLQQAGCIVLHFSWSEVTGKPEECIGEVIGIVKQKYWELDRVVMAAERAAATVGASTE